MDSYEGKYVFVVVCR